MLLNQQCSRSVIRVTNKPVKTAGNPPKNSWHTKRHIPSTFTQNTLQIKQEHAQHCVVTGMHNNITNETRHLVGRNVSSSSPPEFASFESFPLAHCPVDPTWQISSPESDRTRRTLAFFPVRTHRLPGAAELVGSRVLPSSIYSLL